MRDTIDFETWAGLFETETEITRHRVIRAYRREPNTWICVTCGEMDATQPETATIDDKCTHCDAQTVRSAWQILVHTD